MTSDAIVKTCTTVFSIRRFHPESDTVPYWRDYEIETQPGMTVLEGLIRIREDTDPTLSWRYSCRMGICGSCAMVINGKPGLACNTQIHDVDSKRIQLEPLWKFPIVKDLVASLDSMFESHRNLKPYIIRDDTESLDQTDRELGQTPAELMNYMQFSYCIKCGACVAACPTVAIDSKFPGPMPLTAAHRYNSDTRDAGFDARKMSLANVHGVSHCHYAGECSRVCPKGVDPARAIQLMKKDLVKDLFKRGRHKPAGFVQTKESDAEHSSDVPKPPEFTVRR